MRPGYHSIPEAVAVFLTLSFLPCDKRLDFPVKCEFKTVSRLRRGFFSRKNGRIKLRGETRSLPI